MTWLVAFPAGTDVDYLSLLRMGRSHYLAG
jgi:hypothetical protein